MPVGKFVRHGLIVASLLLGACATRGGDPAQRFMAHMDGLPPERQVPNWAHTRALMLRTPPEVGAMAPDFTLRTLDGTETISLAEFRHNRPVVLIFGSWT